MMMMNTRLEAENLVAGYGARPVVRNVSVRIPDGEITVLIGANACGKSTLLKTLAGLIKAESGTVMLEGKPVGSYPAKELARKLGYLPQTPTVPEGVTVADLAARGRYPHRSLFGGWTAEDERAVRFALDSMGISDLADRPFSELSGGQKQRSWIAMALAQKTGILFLDEPTTYLDIAHQVDILDLLADLNRNEGTTVVMVLHELNLAARYADRIIAMKEGRLIAEGRPKDVIDEKLILETFDLEGTIITDPLSHTPLIVPRGRHRLMEAEGS